MRVLYFHQYFSTPLGSSGIRSYEMARKLISQGHEVTMVSGSYIGGTTGLNDTFKNGFRRGYIDGIDVIEYDLKYSNTLSFIQRTKVFLSFALKSIKLTFTEEYDLLFATSTPLTASLPGIVARWLRGKLFIFEVRDLWPELPREMGVITNPIILGAISILEWLSYKSAHALIALSPGIQKGIIKHGILESKVTIIPNGCDLELFDSSNVLNTEEEWQHPEVLETDLLAIYTGTHGIANGLEILIDTANELQVRGRQDIKIVLIGQGKLKPQLMNKAHQLQLTNIIFLDPVNKNKLSQLMVRADLGLQILSNIPAFYYGTSPNKFFDYISAGLPVFNNYPGWIANLITHNKCGKTIPADNQIAFAEALINCADNKYLLPEMGNAAKQLARNQFDRNKLSTEFVNWLEKWKDIID